MQGKVPPRDGRAKRCKKPVTLMALWGMVLVPNCLSSDILQNRMLCGFKSLLAAGQVAGTCSWSNPCWYPSKPRSMEQGSENSLVSVTTCQGTSKTFCMRKVRNRGEMKNISSLTWLWNTQCSDTLSLVILLGSPSSVSICFVGCDTPVARWLTEIETQGVYVLIPLLNYTSFNLGVIIII